MAELPSGTVTFLLTDVEGSTAMWEEAPETMRIALARHDVLFEATVADHGGVHIRPRGEGDSRFAVFASAPDAVAAAIAIQCAFVAEVWPTPRPVTARIGLHTGEAELRDGDYYGSAVNRCARLRGIGHGGQILASEATAALVRHGLAEGVALRDLGEHRLRGLDARERVFQLVSPALPTSFPALVTLETRPHNLPVQPTALVGRERDVTATRALLLRDDVRLLTLTGPGGTGKTRLGLKVAAELLDHVTDGVYFVPLAPLRAPELVVSAIAQVLGVRQDGNRPLLETLQASLRERQLLLVLDNFEHLPAAATLVAELLAVCPRVKVLATSRAPLHVYGEHEFPVPPLELPDLAQLGPPTVLAGVPSVGLFLERAQAVRPDFALTPDNAPLVAEICVRLDGLPLALELAAARIKLLPPRAILARLGSRLNLLSGGARDRPARHQTLRTAVAWSHDLLSAKEQQLLRRLAVFAGGWPLDAAEAVCASGVGVGGPEGSDHTMGGSSPASVTLQPSMPIFDTLAVLVDQSLVQEAEQPDGEPRFSMLETIREYALERLDASREAPAIRRRHADYYLALAEGAKPKLPTDEGAVWLARLEAELDNLRTTLEWSLTAHGDVEVGVRLADSLTWFWIIRGRMREAKSWLAKLLAQTVERTPLRALALHLSGWLALHHGDLPAARVLLDESLALRRDLMDRRGIATTLEGLGLAAHGAGDPGRAVALLEECLSLWEDLGGESTTDLRANLAEAVRDVGDYDRAVALHEQNLAEYRARGHQHGVLVSLRGLGHLARIQRHYERASALLEESLTLVRTLHDVRCAPICLDEVAGVAGAQGWGLRAARLFGAAESMREANGFALPTGHAAHDESVTVARKSFGEERFAAAWSEGRAMTMEEAVEYALSSENVGPSGEAEARQQVAILRGAHDLTRREREVAVLVARGLTDPQIAEALVIGRRTAETHVGHCLSKLGFATRSQLATWAVAQGLTTASSD